MHNKNNLRVCLVGYGYWGKNLLRNLLEILTINQISVAEKKHSVREMLKRQFPNLNCFASFEEAINDISINAFIIATETHQHFEIAQKVLQTGRHVLVEKPLTTSTEEALKLKSLSEKSGVILMVDHIFRYHPVVWKMKEYFEMKHLGDVNYIDCTRVNLGIYQENLNVLWDLACHDLSIIQFLISEKPTSVQAVGRINPIHGTEDVAYLFLRYESGLLVHINASWASPVKIRKMIVGGEKRMMIYDDIEPTNKLTIYDYEQNVIHDEKKTKLTDYRLGNISIPKIEPGEALRNVITEFIHCIEKGQQPAANADSAIDIINILEKAQQSLLLNGQNISLI